MKATIAISLAFALFTANSFAQEYNNIVAFGDSFTDNGYINGHGFNRDTNGLVWVEYLAEMMGCSNIDNRAWGGARTDNGHFLGFNWSGFQWQVDNYSLTLKPEETLFTIWIGVNDYWDNKDDPSNSVQNIIAGLNKLVAKGATNFVVFNNFDLTLSLGYGPNTDYHDLIPVVRKLTQKFNMELFSRLYDKEDGWAKLHPEIKVYFVDIYTFMNELVANKQFNNTPWKGTYQFPDPNEYLWYDEWHPMTSCHKLIAELVLQEMNK